MAGARDRPLADVAAPARILAVVRPGDAVDAFIAFAVALAGVLGFALDFVESYDDPPAGIADCYAIGPAAVADVLRREGEIINRATAPAHQAFDAAVAGGKIAATWAAASAAQLASEATRRARDAAFVLLARPARRLRLTSRLAEHLLTGGTPLLLIPEAPPRHGVFGTILCAWDGSLQAERALRASAPLLARAATVRLISIGDPSPPREAAAPPENILGALAQEGIVAERLRLERGTDSIAATLLDYCARSGADLLVMGAYRHPRMRELLFGGVTCAVLANSAVPVFMAH